MSRYRVLRDFGSHLGNHYRGEHLTLPEGDLPRGFAGFVERVEEPATKEVRPAAGRADGASSAAGADEAAASPPDRSEPEPAPPLPARAETGLYDDKALRSRKRP